MAIMVMSSARGKEVYLVYSSYQRAWFALTLQIMDAHFHQLVKCLFVPVQCSSEGCPEKILRRDIESHISVCTYKLVECGYCNVTVQRKDRDTHYQQACEEFPVS